MIYVYPEELWEEWEYFGNLEDEESELIACDDEKDIAVYLVSNGGKPVISVVNEVDEVESVGFDFESAAARLDSIYSRYLEDEWNFEKLSKLEDDTDWSGLPFGDDDKEQVSIDREFDLFYDTEDFLSGIMESKSSDLKKALGNEYEEIIHDLLNRSLAYLSGRYGLLIFRPTKVGDEWVDYPYDMGSEVPGNEKVAVGEMKD